MEGSGSGKGRNTSPRPGGTTFRERPWGCNARFVVRISTFFPGPRACLSGGAVREHFDVIIVGAGCPYRRRPSSAGTVSDRTTDPGGRDAIGAPGSVSLPGDSSDSDMHTLG